jgi:photosystem II stability/assembly factor-like uncharacterized protein
VAEPHIVLVPFHCYRDRVREHLEGGKVTTGPAGVAATITTRQTILSSGGRPKMARTLLGLCTRIPTGISLLLVFGWCEPALHAQTGPTIVNVLERMQYFHEKRAGGPGRSIPEDAYANALREAAPFRAVAPSLPTGASTTWTTLNPSGLFYAVTNANHVAGRTNSMAFDPGDTQTFYSAAAGGGVWKTTDGGVNWSVLTDGLGSLMSGSIAVDPVNTDILYYGTGELNFSIDSYYGDGIYKSTDGGASWTNVAGASLVRYVSQVAIDPSNTSIIYVSGNTGVLKSTNAGSSWNLLPANSQTLCVIVDPSNTQVLYTSTNGIVQKSTNGGASWGNLGGGLPTTNVGRIQLAMAPSDHNILYASIASSSTSDLRGLYRTTDAGASWALEASSPNYLNGQGWYDNSVCVKPTDPNTVIVGGLDVYKSTTGGGGLAKMTNWSTTSSSDFCHADIHFLGYNGSVLYCGSDGGVFKSTDDGSTWSDLNSTLSTLQFNSGDYDPTNTQRLYGGTQDNDKENSTDGGALWIQRTTGDGGYTVVDPSSTNYVYCQYVNGSCRRSDDFGVTYTEIRPNAGSGGLFYNPFEMAPGDPNTLIYGVAQVWKTTSARTATSTSWTQIANSSTVGGSVSAIGLSATNTDKIYIGTDNGRILATTNNGTSWVTSTGHPYVSDLAVDPDNDNICYATFTGFGAGTHVYMTTDGGNTWSNTTSDLPNIPCNTIVIVPQTPRWLFVGTDLGVYYSTDAGGSWGSYNQGLPTVTIYDLKYKVSTMKLMAATHGRGCFMNDLTTVLPIQLVSFEASVAEGSTDVTLTWRTVSENVNYGFYVQRSTSTSTGFDDVANNFVPGHGTTLVPHLYTWVDTNVGPGKYYYRLKQMNLDGSSTETEPVQVIVAGGITGINEVQRPMDFALDQNYPNPFNPTTEISYQLPVVSEVQLTVFDQLGREVAVLVNEKKEPGSYEVKLDASNLASGIYFYRLRARQIDDGRARQTDGGQAGAFIETRKLVLLK